MSMMMMMIWARQQFQSADLAGQWADQWSVVDRTCWIPRKCTSLHLSTSRSSVLACKMIMMTLPIKLIQVS